MNRSHLFREYFMYRQSFLWLLNIVAKLKHWCEVHEVSSIDSNICAIDLMDTVFAPTHRAIILDVIDNQTAIVNDFCQATAEIDVFICFEVFQVVPAKASCHDQAKHWSPAFATAVQKVIRGLMQAL